MALRIYVFNDNGSQMESQLVQQYYAEKQMTCKFTKPATPDQSGHIEFYHSIIERVICSRFDFMGLTDATDTLDSG